MQLRALEIHDFRNIARATLEPSPRCTVLLGANAQGKTNLLEAVHLLLTLRPLRAWRLAELVRWGCEQCRVEAVVEAAGGERRLRVEVTAAGRSAAVDGKLVEGPGGYLRGLAAVCFSPDDLLMVKGGPELRRRFLDRAAFNRWPAVLTEARDYLRALRARNAALRQGPPEVEESFRAPLVRAAARLLRRRHDLVGELGPRLRDAFAAICGAGQGEAGLAYRPASGMPVAGAEEDLATRLGEILALRVERDRQKGYTSVGPHVDDLSLTLDGRSARWYGSQGQQRALVLSLKVAEIENLRSALGAPPLLLLDDVSSELDPDKNRQLLQYLADLPAQALLTTTDRRLLEPWAGPGSELYRVERGEFTREFSHARSAG